MALLVVASYCYTYVHGWLWLLYSLFTRDGLWLEQWYARPANVTLQDSAPRSVLSARAS